MDEYIIYLRKSRADRDAEARGEGETLARHEKALLALAAKLQLNVTDIYREIVSGETIAARPEVQKLLQRIEDEEVKGVLVMEVERLARGDTSDQGLIASAFKDNNVKIITPTKTFDPNDEFDEEYFEFNLFMSRREYKTINRRIQRGRIASVKEGKFIGSTAPFGYEKVKLSSDKGYTLQIIPEEAEIVKKIFEWYTSGQLQEDGSYKTMGAYVISKELDKLGIKPRVSEHWSSSSITDILKNPTYTGKIRWSYKIATKKKDGSRTVKNENYILVDGLHKAIIDESTYLKAAGILKGRCNPTVPGQHCLKNPLSGLVFCKKCGRLMNRAASNTKTRYDVLFCPNKYCDNISAPLDLIENKIITSLQTWVDEYDIIWQEQTSISDDLEIKAVALSRLETELTTLNKQLLNTYDLLERKVYDTDTFLSRNQLLTGKIREVEARIAALAAEQDQMIRQSNTLTHFIPEVRNILQTYQSLESAATKNKVLKTILLRVEYLKTSRNSRTGRDNANFEIEIFPKLPG